MKQSEIEKQEAITELKTLFEKANYKVYTELEHISRSGMLRYIKAFVIIENEPWHINYLIAKLGHYPRATANSHHEGLKLGGCGMDMGFELVYSTSATVFKDLTDEERKQIYLKTKREYDAKNHAGSSGYVLKQVWV